MANVMIKCPKTGDPVPTGIGMDYATFKSVTMSGNTFGPCPSCGSFHTWDGKDAFPDS